MSGFIGIPMHTIVPTIAPRGEVREEVVPVDRGYARSYSDYNDSYTRHARPRDLRTTPRTNSRVGRIVTIIDNGNNINGSLMASLVTIRVRHHNFGATVLSTSVANPSVPGIFNLASRTANSRGNVCPIAAGANVGIVSVGLLLRSTTTPIM